MLGTLPEVIKNDLKKPLGLLKVLKLILIQGTLCQLVGRKLTMASIFFSHSLPIFFPLPASPLPTAHACMPGNPLQRCLHIHAVIGRLFLMRPCRAIDLAQGISKKWLLWPGRGGAKDFGVGDKVTDTCLFICFFQNMLSLDDGYSFSSSRLCPIILCMLELPYLRNF